jgi:hypothetical protein
MSHVANQVTQFETTLLRPNNYRQSETAQVLQVVRLLPEEFGIHETTT